ncbi:MAG: site-specific integrase [Desulfobacteraceae bacterium]|nr:site-specific integrase [Desulfobacteraceae bacterium]
MSLIRRGRYYWLDIRIRGQRIRRSLHTTHKTVALARYGEKKEELDSELGGGKIRFSDFCDKYISWAWSSKPASALREQQRLRKIRDFFQGLEIVYLDDITSYHIEQLKAELKKNGLSKATINRYLQILRGLFYKAIDWEVYNKPNPLKKIRFYREESPVEGLSPEDVQKILLAARAISKKSGSKLQALFHDLVMFALNTGMRKSEVLNLTWDGVKGDIISIRGKGEKGRIVPLNLRAKAIIIRQPRKDQYIFDIPNRHQPDLFRRTIIRIRKETGINFHFHLLRHYFVSILLEKGVDITTIGDIVGHSRKMTSLLYSHTDKERKRKAVSLLE